MSHPSLHRRYSHRKWPVVRRRLQCQYLSKNNEVMLHYSCETLANTLEGHNNTNMCVYKPFRHPFQGLCSGRHYIALIPDFTNVELRNKWQLWVLWVLIFLFFVPSICREIGFDEMLHRKAGFPCSHLDPGTCRHLPVPRGLGVFSSNSIWHYLVDKMRCDRFISKPLH